MKSLSQLAVKITMYMYDHMYMYTCTCMTTCTCIYDRMECICLF